MFNLNTIFLSIYLRLCDHIWAKCFKVLIILYHVYKRKLPFSSPYEKNRSYFHNQSLVKLIHIYRIRTYQYQAFPTKAQVLNIYIFNTTNHLNDHVSKLKDVSIALQIQRHKQTKKEDYACTSHRQVLFYVLAVTRFYMTRSLLTIYVRQIVKF